VAPLEYPRAGKPLALALAPEPLQEPDLELGIPADSPAHSPAQTWAEIQAEWERAQALMACSRRLIAEASALCSTVDAFLRASRDEVRAADAGATPQVIPE
jgi:hypothetical protein